MSSLLTAALHQPPTPYQTSPNTTRSTPASSTSSRPSTSRGGHRRLQGATVVSAQTGLYTCHWSHPAPCSLSFPTPQALHTHILTTHLHSTHTSHPCHWAGCSAPPFPTKPKLIRHLHSHTQFKPHACHIPGCGAAFVTSQQLNVHLKTHTGERPYACPHPTCNKTFAYRDLLKTHLRSACHGTPVKKFLCHICGEGFSDSSNRAKHVRGVHDSEAGVGCPDCAYVDTRREGLRRHFEGTGHGKSLLEGGEGAWEMWFGEMLSLRRRGKRKRGVTEEVEGTGMARIGEGMMSL
ncbi:hypothetical protein B0A48_02911 [Cryoendolithus antarcticus]|uniref:C2H2-type domain-containing protein n=1 Tax=Cryoendolithus antarcticus TaxID=1507870 RepID=A0A1V8TLM1_9PEZI|nr:hypothetical protein B0A48_02911 [Cryoendolithus antarcticus]